MRTSSQAGFTGATLYLLGGLIVWGVRFLGVYIFAAVACARGTAELVPAVVIVSALLGSAICLVLIFHAIRKLKPGDPEENARFIHVVAALVAGVSILAMIWEIVPVLIVPVCPA